MMSTPTHDPAAASHWAAFEKIAIWKGRIYAQAARSFAARQEQQLLRYDEAQELVYLADGEPYSWRAIMSDAGTDRRGTYV